MNWDRFKSSSLGVSILYAVVGSLWIVLGDLAVDSIFQSDSIIYQTIKGLTYVVLTASGLYWLIKKSKSRLIREHKSLLHAYLYNPNPIINYDDELKEVAELNDAAKKFFGLSSETSSADLNLLEEYLVEEHKGKLKSCIESTKHGDKNTLRLTFKTGSKRRYTLTMVKAFKQPQYPYHRKLLITINDTTVIEEAKKQEQKFSKINEEILKSIKDGLFVLNKDMEFSYVNHSFEELTNMGKEELLGRKIKEVFPETVKDGTLEKYLQVLNEESILNVEVYGQHIEKWLRITAFPSNDNHVTVYFKDIHQRKLLQIELENYKKNLETVINASKDLIWSVDGSSKLILFNDSYREAIVKATGIEPKVGDILPYQFPESPDSEDALINQYKGVLNGEEQHFETTLTFRDKSKLDLRVDLYPIELSNNENGLAGYAENVTQRNTFESKILEQNQMLKDIAWSQSHKVRMPLSSLIGLIDLYDLSGRNEELNKEVIQKIGRVSKDLDNIIREIVSKSESLIRNEPEDLKLPKNKL